MKRYITLIVLLLMSVSWVLAQEGAPKGFSYQALIYDGEKPLASAEVTLEVTLQNASTELYRERHTKVKTSDLGLVNLLVGAGTPVKGTLSGVDWESGVFIALHVERNGALESLGNPVRVPTVPYALYASESVGMPQGTGQDVNKPIFQVLNSQGKDVFSVYEHGVRVSVADEALRGVRGGFAVATYSLANQKDMGSMLLSEGRMGLVLEEAVDRGVRGGFAVATRSGTGAFTDRLFISGPSTDVLVDESLRGVRGGFAVATRGNAEPNFEIGDGGVRFTTDPAYRGVRGGFAVSHYSEGRGSDAVQELMMLNDQVSYFTLRSSANGASGSNFSLRDRRDESKVVTSFASAGTIYSGTGDPSATIKKRPDDMGRISAIWKLQTMSNGSRWNYPTVTYDGKPVQYTLSVMDEHTDDRFEVRRIYNPELKSYVDGIVLKEGSSVTADERLKVTARVELVENPLLHKPLNTQVLFVENKLLNRVVPMTKLVKQDGGENGTVSIWVVLDFGDALATNNGPIANLPYSAEIIDPNVAGKATVRRDVNALVFTMPAKVHEELNAQGVLGNVKVKLSSEYLQDKMVELNVKLYL